MVRTVDLVTVLLPTMKESMPACVMRLFRAACLGVVGVLVFTAPAFAQQAAGQPPSVPAPRLNWSPCRDSSDFECARAQVPLDYRYPRRRAIELAVIKREATNPARRVGTLFWNPGGPGAAGTAILPLWYEFFPREVRERFDIVTWDPRGVGQSTAVRCFDSAEEALTWRAHVPAGVPVGTREREIWIRAYTELGRRCHRQDRELLLHVSTADTARDLDQLRQAVGDEQLTYLGTSYGTFLGATYANLFPDRVRAMVLDAVVDPQAYMNTGAARDLLLNTGLRLGSDRSSAATLDQFLGHCGAATIERCAFSAGSPKATREKFDELMRRLQAHPQGVWTYGRTVDTVTIYLFSVHPNWTTLAAVLQDLWEGRTPEQPEPPEGPAPYPGFEQEYAVVCSESVNPRNPNRYHPMEEWSYARAGDVGRWWTWDYEPCATWPARATNRYSGPWNRPTANPILVVGNTYDPATPYEGAQALVRELADAHLLTLDGYGHTALRNPSTCIHEHESRYLIDGTLPPKGTVCQQDQPPFAMYSPARETAIVVVSTKQANAITPLPMLQALAMAIHGPDIGFGLTPEQALEPNLLGAGPAPE
jgi:pimeloyl-ACP methyl ester carboxylesterase